MTHKTDEEIVEHCLGMKPKFLETKNWVEYIVRLSLASRPTCEEAVKTERENGYDYHLNVMQEIGNALAGYDHKSFESGKSVLHIVNEIIKKDIANLKTHIRQ